MDAINLKNLIESSLENTQALIQSDDNVHFDAIIISEQFESIKNKVKQQQLVYHVINDYIKSGEVHAISMKTYTPAQWQKLNHES